MKKLFPDLVLLSSLRDRDELDLTVLSLVGRIVMPERCSAKWVSLVGQANNQRWLINAWLDPQTADAQRSTVWSDLTSLPPRDAIPHWSAALESNAVTYLKQGTHLAIFPVATQDPVCRLLEIETPSALQAEAVALILQVLMFYQNLQALLDYGEKDPLTQLLNRKTFDHAFSRAALAPTLAVQRDDLLERRHVDTGQRFWLAMLDVDHFKKVNDTYGHLIGDEVLLLLARHMRNSFRFDDQLYRFGGEEFVVLMRCANSADAVEALERLRSSVEQHAFPQVGNITVSIGFCSLDGNDTPTSAIGRADKAVYFAKGNGRNQVCSYDQLVTEGHLVEVSEELDETDFF